MTKSLSVSALADQGRAVIFDEEGWFNATVAAERFGKRPHDWLSLDSTKEYLAAMESKCGKIPYYKTRRGGDARGVGNVQGTWLHPQLGIPFSRWLDGNFAVWCDEHITRLSAAAIRTMMGSASGTTKHA